MKSTCLLPAILVLEKPGGSGMFAVDLGGLGRGFSRAATHGGRGGGGKADCDAMLVRLGMAEKLIFF